MLPGSLARSSLVMIALWRVDGSSMREVLAEGISFCGSQKTPTNTVVTLGLDPRGLHLSHVRRVKSPRVKPEGDDLGLGGHLASTKLSSWPVRDVLPFPLEGEGASKGRMRVLLPSTSIHAWADAGPLTPPAAERVGGTLPSRGRVVRWSWKSSDDPKQAVDALPLVGRDQGWGWFGPDIRAPAPLPTYPQQRGRSTERSVDNKKGASWAPFVIPMP